MIQSGTIRFGDGADASPAWGLHQAPGDWTSTPPRSEEFRSADIPFPIPFGGIPMLVLSLAGIGIVPSSEGITAPWVVLSAEDIQPEEFNIRIRTGAGSQLGEVWVTWIAHDPG